MTGIERLRKIACNYRGLSRKQRYLGINVLREADLLDNIADQIERETQPRRDPAADASVSAYDLLPEEDREAIAWVRYHGGLESVKKLLNWVVGHCSTKQQLDFDFWLSGRVMHELGFDEDMADRYEVERRLLARLMPEGMEWPRFEDGEPVRPGDKLLDKDGDWFEAVSFVFTCDWWSVRGYQTEGFGDLNDETRRKLEGMAYGTCVKRPAPKVLDADTWERLEEDCAKSDVDYCAERGLLDPSCDTVEGDGSTRHCTDCGCTCGEKMARDLMRRARALSERERGE